MATLDDQINAVKTRKKGKPVASPEPEPPAIETTPQGGPIVKASEYPYDKWDIWKLRKFARLRKIPHWQDRPRAGLLIALHADDDKKKGQPK
jgi:hypothetical protein